MTEPNSYEQWRTEQLANAGDAAGPDKVEQAVTGVVPADDSDQPKSSSKDDSSK